MTLLIQAAIETTTAAQITGALDRFANFILQYAIALAAVGAMAMALVETWKRLRDSRTRFHSRQMAQWMSQRVDTVEGLRNMVNVTHPLQHLQEVLQLAAGCSSEESLKEVERINRTAGALGGVLTAPRHPSSALFALDLERLMGNLQDATDIALNSPSHYSALYIWITYGAAEEDVERWIHDAASASIPEPEMAGEHGDDTRAVREWRAQKRSKEGAERFMRLRQIAKRRLDAFQLRVGDKWSFGNQVAANVVGACVMFVSLVAVRGTLPAWTIIPLSLLGGIVAPVAKDLVSALKNARG